MATAMNYDLLNEPLFSVDAEEGSVALNLPEVLARLGRGEQVEFPSLRPHQHHAWHAFLVQLAALVVHRRGGDGLGVDAETWRLALIDLAGDAGAAAWHLVVEDPALPAFLQTPAPERSLEPYSKTIPTPDSLDLLIATKNHDLKMRKMTSPTSEHWCYALVSLQTMDGFLGRGNYGIARMNGGFSNRPCLTMTPGLGWAERFQRDVRTWLDSRPELVGEAYGYRERGGHQLLWLLPWDGEKSSKHALSECDPFFIEICRRIRLVGSPIREARMSPTDDYLLDGASVQGNTGDVWTPVNTDGAALTVSGSGFQYRLLTRLLFSGDFRLNPALEVRDEDGPEPLLLAQTLVRGQGKTEGFHQRTIRLPATTRRLLLTNEGRDRLGALAKAQVEKASLAERKVLHLALCSLLQKGSDKLDFREARTQPWIDAMDRAVDEVFFECLWAAAELSEGEADALWQTRLRDFAWQQLEDALASAPTSTVHGPRARARAELMFRGLARKHLPLAFPEEAAGKGDESAAD